jgi:hypothetical protein
MGEEEVASTEWIVTMKMEDIEHVTYGTPVQCIVNAPDAATARATGAKLLGGDASKLEVTSLGELGEASGPGIGNWDNLPTA